MPVLITRDSKLQMATLKLKLELPSTPAKHPRYQSTPTPKSQESRQKLNQKRQDVLKPERPIEMLTTKQRRPNSLLLEKKIVFST